MNNLEVLLQPLEGDYWVFQILWMNEACRGLEGFNASNGWKIESSDAPALNEKDKNIWLRGRVKSLDLKPILCFDIPLEEIEKALTEWSTWFNKQIRKKEIKEPDNPYIIKV